MAADHFALTCEYYSEAGPVPFLRVARGDTDNAHLEAALSAYGVAAAALARENLGVSLDATNSGKLTLGQNYRPAIVKRLANARLSPSACQIHGRHRRLLRERGRLRKTSAPVCACRPRDTGYCGRG